MNKRGTNLRDAIQRLLHNHGEEMAQLLVDLVSIPTENPPGNNYLQCAELLERSIRALGLECELLQTSGPQPGSTDGACLLAGHGHGERTLCFHGHYDVVPAQSAQQFEPRREKDVLFGRGTGDMKGGIVAMLYAIRALKECAVPLTGRVALTLVSDEETGGERGSKWLAKQSLLGRNGIGMITAEPTSGVIWNANRGAITLKITVHGKPAHVGLQHRGENAFERMHRVVEELLILKQEVEQRKTSHAVAADEARSEESGRKTARHSILLLGGQCAGGTNFNVVPDQCWFTLDRRINPEEDLQTEKQRLINVLEECRRDGIPLEWEVFQEGSAASCSPDEAVGRALRNSAESVAGNSPRFELCPGLLETRFYAERGVPAYAYGPGLLSVAHGPNEFVDLRRVEECAVIYALTAAQVLRP